MCNIKEIREKRGLTVRITKHAEIEQWKRNAAYEVIIHATPVPVKELIQIEHLTEEITIIDISSMRVEVGEFTEKNIIHYFPAPPLPGKVAPHTAGELLGSFLHKTVQSGGIDIALMIKQILVTTLLIVPDIVVDIIT